jgi:hypothetical protein
LLQARGFLGPLYAFLKGREYCRVCGGFVVKHLWRGHAKKLGKFCRHASRFFREYVERLFCLQYIASFLTEEPHLNRVSARLRKGESDLTEDGQEIIFLL